MRLLYGDAPQIYQHLKSKLTIARHPKVRDPLQLHTLDSHATVQNQSQFFSLIQCQFLILTILQKFWGQAWNAMKSWIIHFSVSMCYGVSGSLHRCHCFYTVQPVFFYPLPYEPTHHRNISTVLDFQKTFFLLLSLIPHRGPEKKKCPHKVKNDWYYTCGDIWSPYNRYTHNC